MRDVYKNLYVGSQKDYETGTFDDEWAFLLAAKEPWHRKTLGYTGRAAAKDHPEYLMAYRDNKLILNLVDAPKSIFFSKEIIDAALDYIKIELAAKKNVLICCNLGESRSPSIALLYLIKNGIIEGDTLEDCEAKFLQLYPEYNPGAGIRGFMQENFSDYRYITEEVITYDNVETNIEEILKKVNGPEEKEYEIWSEGYACSGEHSCASFLGRFKGRSFLEACVNSSKEINILLDEDNNFLRVSNIFGCELFDNEADARKGFG